MDSYRHQIQTDIIYADWQLQAGKRTHWQTCADIMYVRIGREKILVSSNKQPAQFGAYVQTILQHINFVRYFDIWQTDRVHSFSLLVYLACLVAAYSNTWFFRVFFTPVPWFIFHFFLTTGVLPSSFSIFIKLLDCRSTIAYLMHNHWQVSS